MTLSHQDIDLDIDKLNKYTKFLALKATLVIIQSRQGDKISTSCKPPTSPTTAGSDWFYINVGTDLMNVVSETKRLLEGDAAKISKHTPLCVEISLRTSDGEKMVLEYWCLAMEHDTNDLEVKNINLLYARMGILLRSLISVTRVTPTYKYSRKQGPENHYVICYRIFLDKPQLHSLGEGYKQTRIGQICTPVSKIDLSVAYRTKMSLSPTQAGKSNDIMVKSDHFNANANTRRYRNNSEDDINDLTKPMKQGAFAEPKKIISPEPQLPDVTRLLAMGKKSRRSVTSDSDNESSCGTSAEETKKEKVAVENPPPLMTSPSMTSINSIQTDDFWLKGLEAPFAHNSYVGELMNFYRDCKKCPPLKPSQNNPSPAEISEMIENFESRMPEYDALVQSFCESSEDNV